MDNSLITIDTEEEVRTPIISDSNHFNAYYGSELIIILLRISLLKVSQN